MRDNKLHTPDGVRDILFDECGQKIELESIIKEVFRRYGYKNIQSPTFEYYEVYANEKGNIEPRHMYKFFDREGNILVLRPDITPAIARIAATNFIKEKNPIRICYLSNIFRYNENYTGKPRESTQAGVELLGIDSSESDAEIITLAVNCMIVAGFDKFQIDIGQVDFFKGIIEESGLDEKVGEELRYLIDQKNFIAVEKILQKFEMEKQLKDLILNLPKLYGSVEIIGKARNMTTNKRALKALNRLKKVYDILCDYGVEKYITFDLGMVNRLNYYTGIIFRGYTYGIGVSIIDGGRYDSLLRQFGKDYPAVGFGIVMDELINAMKREKIGIKVLTIDTLLLYNEKNRKNALTIAENYRISGMSIQTGLLDKDLEQNIKYGKQKGIGGILNFIDENRVQLINLETDEVTETYIDLLIEKGDKK